LVALSDKEAETVAQGIFNRWICRYGSPLQITTDGGKEFCANLSKQLYKLMQIEHLTTSPYHPQCNSQVEIVNKTIAKYLAAFVDDTTLDWELYLPPLMFSYNTSMHSTTKFTPYFLTFGQKPRAPHFPAPDIARKFYGESTIDEMWIRLQQARQLAIKNNELVRDNYEEKYNKEVTPISYAIGQEVFLDEHNFLHKNKKLSPLYSGPHIIQKLIGKTNAQLKLKNGRSTIVHLNRIKPFLSQSDKLVQHQKETAQEVNLHPPSEDEENEEKLPTPQNFSGHPRNILPTLATPPIIIDEAGAGKKKRGRPAKPKTVRTTEQERHIATPPPTHPPTQEGEPVLPVKRVTRAQLQQMSDEQKAEYFVAISFIDALKQLTSELSSVKNKRSVKNKKSSKNKQSKNGTGNDTWSTLQKAYFKKFGDTFGQTVGGTPRFPHGDLGLGHESDSESSSDNDSQSDEEHSDAGHSDHHSGGESNPEDEGDEKGRPPSPPGGDSSSSDEFVDAKDVAQAENQARNDQHEKQIPEGANKVVEKEKHLDPGYVPPLQKEQLPIIPGPQQPKPIRHAMAPEGQTKVPKPTIPVHGTQKMPTGTRAHTQNTVLSACAFRLFGHRSGRRCHGRGQPRRVQPFGDSLAASG
jgi:hypothetical protein